MERMPGDDTRAASLPTRLHLEISFSGLWADRQGLALIIDRLKCLRGHVSHPCEHGWSPPLLHCHSPDLRRCPRCAKVPTSRHGHLRPT
jgi:hypothetical protein